MGYYNYLINNDLEIEIFANNYNELFFLLTNCFAELVSSIKVSGNIFKKIDIDFEDIEFLPIDYFNELIYIFDKDSFVATSVEFNIAERKFSGNLYGFFIDRKYVKKILKAATYHDYIFKNTGKVICLKMIVDI